MRRLLPLPSLSIHYYFPTCRGRSNRLFCVHIVLFPLLVKFVSFVSDNMNWFSANLKDVWWRLLIASLKVSCCCFDMCSFFDETKIAYYRICRQNKSLPTFNKTQSQDTMTEQAKMRQFMHFYKRWCVPVVLFFFLRVYTSIDTYEHVCKVPILGAVSILPR